MMIHKSHKPNPYLINGQHMPAHIAGLEIRTVSSSVPTRPVESGSAIKEYFFCLYQGEAGFASHIIFHLVKSKHN